MLHLTFSMQNYIRTIYESSMGNIGVRVSDIAEILGISKASVCVAMRNLEKNGMIGRDENRLVFLTDEGLQQAVLIVDKLNIIKCFLVEKLHLNTLTAQQDAFEIEKVISHETLCSMCRKLDYTSRKQRCHGECCAHEAACTQKSCKGKIE